MADDTENTDWKALIERHYLVRMNDRETGLSVWKVLCLKCRNALGGFKRQSISELPCECCGKEWKAPPGGNLFVKDKRVTITATYPDLETARNAIEDK